MRGGNNDTVMEVKLRTVLGGGGANGRGNDDNGDSRGGDIHYDEYHNCTARGSEYRVM